MRYMTAQKHSAHYPYPEIDLLRIPNRFYEISNHSRDHMDQRIMDTENDILRIKLPFIKKFFLRDKIRYPK